MKVLFYGGCHAGVLRRAFERFAPEGHTFDHITNFTLIASRKPFPYDYAATFDAVVYSPIANKGDYNTDRLKAFCEANGIQTVCFPWLQWNGYFPGCIQGQLLGFKGWIYPQLFDLMAEMPFDLAYDMLLRATFLGDTVHSALERTTEHLVAHETTMETDFRVSDFILQHYKRSRLFLTPNHPSTTLYKYVAWRIAEHLGISLDKGFFTSGSELQPEKRVPILPGVADQLGLEFCDSDFEDRENLPRRVFSLREYLTLYADRAARLLRARTHTFIKSQPGLAAGLSVEDKVACRPTDFLVTKGLQWPMKAQDMPVEIISTSATTDKLGRAFVYSGHWIN
ncbi:WcbI family polysaccharide biosynthesis putative acetyltransferase [Microvirga sp. VF16]|uniref:WcbI family polysaccharide biosynthesis putative acetyltransferase n=1 Tax=Microvirga sp. VF16 TaxID=2807101 RepID=UPI00193E48CD|nr:WcbI family polysaccharide biosynthesis putative acetyltransferase [Microvirga sp. VF16]QRM35615.1 hypothetical protein JO965_43080 [Microvirga sp. VF16]